MGAAEIGVSVPGLSICKACGDYWIPATGKGGRPSSVCDGCRWMKCPQCGELVKGSGSAVLQRHAQYCSRECYDVAKAAKMYTCESCGEEFKATSGGGVNKYCSRECAFEDLGRWHNAGSEPTKTSECWQCGTGYLVAESDADWGNAYCSGLCQAKGVSRSCRECGDEFQAQHAATLYCSDACRVLKERRRAQERWENEVQGRSYSTRQRRRVECATCGVEFSADSAQRYCSIGCRPSRSGSKSRHFAYVLKRDRRRCQLCWQPVAWTKRAPHPRSPTVDHIIPRSRGGKDVKRNVHLAHWECNVRKGNGAAGEQMLCVG